VILEHLDSGARRAHRVDCEAAILEQLIEHAPGECAMRASTLQRQVYRFLIGHRSTSWRAADYPSHDCAIQYQLRARYSITSRSIGRHQPSWSWALFMPRNCVNCVVMGSASIHSVGCLT